jgi:hypothetical protein
MQARPKILIVEDEPAQREILLYHCKRPGLKRYGPTTVKRVCYWRKKICPIC